MDSIGRSYMFGTCMNMVNQGFAAIGRPASTFIVRSYFIHTHCFKIF